MCDCLAAIPEWYGHSERQREWPAQRRIQTDVSNTRGRLVLLEFEINYYGYNDGGLYLYGRLYCRINIAHHLIAVIYL
ncbi:hypothetical protein D3C78_674250 [compost metagenome]